MFGFWLIRTIGRALPSKIRGRIAWVIGARLIVYRRQTRQAVSHNLQRITRSSEKTVAPLLRRMGGHFARYLSDFLCRKEVERTRLAAELGKDIRPSFERIVPHGRGAMVVTAHLGHWEFGAEMIAQWGYPVTVVYHPHRSPAVDRLFAAARSPRIRWVPVGAQAARAAWRALKAGQVVATAADRLYGDAGVPVSLCGSQALIPRGPFVLAAKARVPLVCAFVVHVGSGRYAGRIEPPLSPSGDTPMAIQELAQQFAAILERYLQRYPDQWYVFERFWNDRNMG